MTRLATAALAALIAGGSVAALSVAEPGGNTIAGYAVAVDGDTLRIGAARIRLVYIDAPESRQTCTSAQRAPWACGEASSRALSHMLDRDPLVSCQAKATDRYGRTVAVCRNSSGDLGAMMVAQGWAIDVPRYSGSAYRDHEAAAKAERLGIWAGSFTLPADWRKAHR